MAGEIGHVIYAARLLTYLKDRVKHSDYWLGTLFPDIRHLGVVSRQRTHPKDVSLHTLVGSNDFHTGMRVHAWLDHTREKFFQAEHIKEHLPWHPFVPFCLNLLEDELLYDYFDDWDLIFRILNTKAADEHHYTSSTTVINTWHTILQNYFRHLPTDASRYELAHSIGLSEAMAKEANSVMHLLRKDGRAEKLLERFWQHLESLLKK